MNGSPGPARLVILLQDLKFGGSQTQALELARGLDPALFKVELWTLMGGQDLLPQARAWGLRVRQLGGGGYVWPPALIRLARALHRRRPDLLLLYTGIPNIWGRLLGRPAGVPLIVATCRGSLEPQRQHERLLWRRAHHHICNANSLKDLLVLDYGVDPAVISTIPNGVDTERFSPAPAPPKGEPLVLGLGRLSREKGQATLLEAFCLVADRHPQAQLWLVGDGPQRGRLLRMARACPCAERIRIMPARKEVEQMLRRASLLALPSRHEGMPNVALEAMASGLPVLASRLAGMEELVAHQETGILLPVGDAPAWAEALHHLLSQPQLGRAWGRQARRRAMAAFSLQAMIQAHQDLFQRLLAGQGR